jgi:hypothetical protein
MMYQFYGLGLYSGYNTIVDAKGADRLSIWRNTNKAEMTISLF